MSGSDTVAPASASTRNSALWEGLRDIFSGIVSGIAGRVTEHPFDTLKTRMQASLGGGSFTKYNGAWDCFVKIMKGEGVRGLYRGMSAPLVGTIFETSTLFFFNGRLKRMLSEQGDLAPGEELPMPLVLLAGAGTGFFVSFILTPVELIKCRLQVAGPGVMGVTSPLYTGPIHCLRRSIAEDGAGVLFRGHVGTMLREIPGTAVWFASYEWIVRAMTPPGGSRDDLPPAVVIAAGALAGVSYWSVMFPSDTVKALMQLPTQEDAPAASSASSSASASGTAGTSSAGSGHAGAAGTSSSGAAARPLAGHSTSPQFAAAARSYSTLSGSLLGSALSSSASLQSRCSGGLGQAARPHQAGSLLPAALHSALSRSSSSASSAAQYVRHTARQPGFFEMFAHVYRTAGMRGLYAGFIPTVIRAAPSNSVIFVAYEWTSAELKRLGEPNLI